MQRLIITLIVLIAAISIARRMFRSFIGSKSSVCGNGCGCGGKKQRGNVDGELVSVNGKPVEK